MYSRILREHGQSNFWPKVKALAGGEGVREGSKKLSSRSRFLELQATPLQSAGFQEIAKTSACQSLAYDLSVLDCYTPCTWTVSAAYDDLNPGEALSVFRHSRQRIPALWQSLNGKDGARNGFGE